MSIEDLGVDFNKLFFEGLWKGISMWFDTPLKLLLTLGIIALIILGWILDIKIYKKKVKYIARQNAKAMIEAEEEYIMLRDKTKD